MFAKSNPSIHRVVSQKKKRKPEVSALAQASFDAFEPFLNVFDPGRRWNGPYHTITKEDWRLYALYKQGQKPAYEDGRPFNPYRDVVRNIYSPNHVQEELDGEEIGYFTGGKRGLSLLYGDIDAHAEWQTDQLEARKLLAAVLPAFWTTSFRGENALLKIRYRTWAEANETAKVCEQRLRRYLRSHGILCDFEIKGLITTKASETTEDKSGSLAKLPFYREWNYDRLAQFERTPIHSVTYVRRVVEHLVIDEAQADFWEAHVQRLKDEDDNAHKALLEENKLLATGRVQQKVIVPGQQVHVSAHADTQSGRVAPIDVTKIRGLNKIRSLPCALDRAVQVFLVGSRAKGRPLTTDECLQIYQDKGLHSGDWDNNPARRHRFEWVVARYGPKFQADKCQSSPKGVTYELQRELLKRVEHHKRMSFPSQFRTDECRALVAIMDLNFQKNEDDSIPENWIKPQWESLRKLGVIKRAWSVVRRVWPKIKRWLYKQGLVLCNFRSHRVGKGGKDGAHKYWKGEQFPKERKRKTAPYTYPTTNKQQLPNTLDGPSTSTEPENDRVEGFGLPPPRGSPSNSVNNQDETTTQTD